MTASYPGAIPTWTIKRNYLDIVWAEHMNRVQEETEAIQKTLGVVPQRATSNPGGKTPDHGTVAARIQSVARGEHVPFFRGSVREYVITPNGWFRPSLHADDDPFNMYSGNGIKLNESGLWMITLKADWKGYTETTQQNALRMLRLEVDGNDIGVRHSIIESTSNRALLHNNITWTETWPAGTTISMGLRTNMASSRDLHVHAYLRAHLVRCHQANGDGGSIPFEDIPDPNPGSPGNPGTCYPRPQREGRRFCIHPCNIGGLMPYFTRNGHLEWSMVDVPIIDNTHPNFSSSIHPTFDTWEEAAAYREQFWLQVRDEHVPRQWTDTIDDVLTGLRF